MCTRKGQTVFCWSKLVWKNPEEWGIKNLSNTDSGIHSLLSSYHYCLSKEIISEQKAGGCVEATYSIRIPYTSAGD